MSPQRSCTAALLALALLGLAAPGAAASATTAKPKAWVKLVCTSIADWSEDVDATWSAAATSAPTTPTEGRTALARALRKLAKRTDKVAATLERGGAPDVDGGKATAQGIVEMYRTLADALRDTRTDVKALPVDDPATFSAALNAVSVDLQVVLADVELDLSDLDLGATALQDAIDAVPACNTLADG